jgi:hypothetical protein
MVAPMAIRHAAAAAGDRTSPPGALLINSGYWAYDRQLTHPEFTCRWVVVSPDEMDAGVRVAAGCRPSSPAGASVGSGSGSLLVRVVRSRVHGCCLLRVGTRAPCPFPPLQARGAFRSGNGQGPEDRHAGIRKRGRLAGAVPGLAVGAAGPVVAVVLRPRLDILGLPHNQAARGHLDGYFVVTWTDGLWAFGRFVGGHLNGKTAIRAE